MDKQSNIKDNNIAKENIISPEMLKKNIDNAYDEIFIYNNNYRVVYVNKACIRHYGLKPEEIIGKSFYELEQDENSEMQYFKSSRKVAAAQKIS